MTSSTTDTSGSGKVQQLSDSFGRSTVPNGRDTWAAWRPSVCAIAKDYIAPSLCACQANEHERRRAVRIVRFSARLSIRNSITRSAHATRITLGQNLSPRPQHGLIVSHWPWSLSTIRALLDQTLFLLIDDLKIDYFMHPLLLIFIVLSIVLFRVQGLFAPRYFRSQERK